jgi:hypothetical protein
MKNTFRFLLILCTVTSISLATATVAIGDVSDDGDRTGYCVGSDCSKFISCSGGDCEIDDLFTLINKIIFFLLFTLAPIFMSIILIWAGFKIITSQGNSSAISGAKKMAWNALTGYIIAVCSFLIIKFILQPDLINDKLDIDKFLQ